MPFSGDPFRTLGLHPGSSEEQIKRAYRTLAKRYHPDSAGEAALPRFLAIQAAYDMLTGTVRHRRPAATGSPRQRPGDGATPGATSSSAGRSQARPAPPRAPAGDTGAQSAGAGRSSQAD